MTKKRLVGITAIIGIVYFILWFNILPASVVDVRMEYNPLFFGLKIIFLSLTTAILTSVLLTLIVRRDFVQRQINTFKNFRHLLKLLVRRDFLTRYRRSALGVLWSLLNPLLTMLVMTMVFSFIFINDIPNFPVYMLSGQILFGFFSESTNQAMGAVIGSAGIIRKVYVPKYIFPMSRVISSLVNLVFSFLAFLLVFIITRSPFHFTMLLIPIPFLYTFVFSLGIGLILATLAVFFKDIQYLYSVFLTLLMYMTPIFYPITRLPQFVQQILGINPLYHFVDYFRQLTLYGTVPDLWSNIVCVAFCTASLCAGLYVFMSNQDRFILYM